MRIPSKFMYLCTAPMIGAAIVGFGQGTNPLIQAHVEKLQATPSLTLKLNVNRLGLGTEEDTLSLGKPGYLRWETPSQLTIVNGSSILNVDKKANTYTEEEATPEKVQKIVRGDLLWAWSPIIDKAFGKDIKSAVTGNVRKIKDVSVKEVAITRGERTMTLMMDENIGIARGLYFTVVKGEEKQNVLVLATKIEFGKEAPAADSLMLKLPEGAKKIEKSDITTWEDVKAIFDGSCGACHGSERPKEGIDVTSYAAIMRGGREGAIVVPGDPDGSNLVQVISGKRRPVMPPRGVMPKDKIDLITKWVKDGCKEK